MEQRTQLRVECPQCHWKHFMEGEIDQSLLASPAAKAIKGELEAWIASRCPDHLGTLLRITKN